ncbi:hypothetical protein D3C76_1818510 [compost metagenome]
MGETHARALELAITCSFEQLVIDLVRHTQTGGRDRMTEAFQAAINLAGEAAIAVVEAV